MSEQDFDSQIQELMEQASYLAAGLPRLALYEEAVRLSDLSNQSEQQYQLRKSLINDAVYCGRQELAFVAFSWCWAKSQESPETYPPINLLWEYKWIISIVWQFPTITKAEIERHYQEMERAYLEHGSTLQVIYYYRMDYSMFCGHLDDAAKYYKLFRETARDQWSDCQACERNNLIEYFMLLGEDQQAVDKAKDLLNGRYSCTSVPESTHSKLMIPLLRLRNPERALAMHRKGYAQIKRQPGYSSHAAWHLQLLALTGNWDEGLKIFKKYLAEGWNRLVPWRRFEFLRGATFFLKSYPARAGRPTTMRVPVEMKLAPANKLVPLTQIAAAVEAEVRMLAESFDRRNGNRALQDSLDQDADLWQYAVDLPLTGNAAKVAKKAQD